MSNDLQLQRSLKNWAEAFMSRSMREMRHFVRSTGLSQPQFNMLMRLYYRGECGISDLSTEMDVSAAAASQLVERMVQLSLLERAEDQADRRVKVVSLTAKGRKLIESGIESRNRWMTDLVKRLPADQHAAITRTLQTLTEATHQLETETK